MEKLAGYYMEQSQKNTEHLFDMMKQTVAASVETLNWAQGEAQKFTSSLTKQGAEQFLTQLEKMQDQQRATQKEFEEQFHSLMSTFQQKGSR